MVSFKKIWVVTVTVAFVFAVISPVCCAQDWSDLAGHEHKMPAHNHKHDNASGCNIPILKNITKPDTISARTGLRLASFAIPFEHGVFEHFSHVLRNYSSRLIFFNKAGPPLFLLHSVFLN